MATSNIKLSFGFSDETTRDLNIGPFAPNAAAVTGAKANIIDFNANSVDDIKSLILSENGASCTGIAEAHIITIDETEINLNDAE